MNNFFLLLTNGNDARVLSLPPTSYATCTAGSIDMERNCSKNSAAEFNMAFVDLGLADEDVHTTFSTHPEAALNAFIDFLFLMDATFIVRPGSSFSGTVCLIKGLRCQESTRADLVGRHIHICLPPDCGII